jgi:SAM-dependent methyltransferase
MDLGFAPYSNAYLNKIDLIKPEKYYPLKAQVCSSCWLVQTEDYSVPEELFNANYAYFSSTSVGWLEHAKEYSNFIINRLKLGSRSLVIEIASNDGYMLKNFIKAGIPCLGIEPTSSTAKVAERMGISVIKEFFGQALAKNMIKNNQMADLIIGNNVYAHVPDINDFTQGLKAILKKDGTITLEFPHILNLINGVQFDTIYHEHFSYFSLNNVIRIFESFGLRIWDVDQLSTHGGSLRIYGCHHEDPRPTSSSVKNIIEQELLGGLERLETYINFQERANKIKNDLLFFLLELKRANKKIAAYGAAAKGNTLLNYAGVKSDLLSFVCDAAPAKQEKFLPGSHIPILHPSALKANNLDYVLILPWNIADEVKRQYPCLVKAGVKFIVAVPRLSVDG